MNGICNPKVSRIWFPHVAVGFSFVLLSFYTSYYHGDFILPTAVASSQLGDRVDFLSARLAYALRCSFPMLITLIAGILIIGTKRGLTAAVNPLSGNEGLLFVDKQYLSNTLEQYVVGLTLMLTVATYTESPHVLRLLPAYAFVFTIGRVLFRIGYSFHGMYRACGMSMNLGGMYVMIVVAAYHLFTGGLTGGLDLPWLPNAKTSAMKGEL